MTRRTVNGSVDTLLVNRPFKLGGVQKVKGDEVQFDDLPATARVDSLIARGYLTVALQLPPRGTNRNFRGFHISPRDWKFFRNANSG